MLLFIVGFCFIFIVVYIVGCDDVLCLYGAGEEEATG